MALSLSPLTWEVGCVGWAVIAGSTQLAPGTGGAGWPTSSLTSELTVEAECALQNVTWLR